jgi:hypothetical protein
MVHPVVCQEAGLRPPQSCQGEEGQLLKAEDVKAFGAVAADMFEYERYACSNPWDCALEEIKCWERTCNRQRLRSLEAVGWPCMGPFSGPQPVSFHLDRHILQRSCRTMCFHGDLASPQACTFHKGFCRSNGAMFAIVQLCHQDCWLL